jgi:hypothetical protein
MKLIDILEDELDTVCGLIEKRFGIECKRPHVAIDDKIISEGVSSLRDIAFVSLIKGEYVGNGRIVFPSAVRYEEKADRLYTLLHETGHYIVERVNPGAFSNAAKKRSSRKLASMLHALNEGVSEYIAIESAKLSRCRELKKIALEHERDLKGWKDAWLKANTVGGNNVLAKLYCVDQNDGDAILVKYFERNDGLLDYFGYEVGYNYASKYDGNIVSLLESPPTTIADLIKGKRAGCPKTQVYP